MKLRLAKASQLSWSLAWLSLAKWAKKKFGYGWITVTLTTYTCVQDKCDTEPPESGLKEKLCIPNDGILNFSESLEDSRSLGGIAD